MSEVIINTLSQPYELVTDIGVEYGAKGECKPSASVRITRHLENGDNLTELVKADLARGSEELMAAIAEIQKKGVRV